MANTIQAIINLVSHPKLELVEYYNSRHRANSEGGSLEEYIKDLYAGTLYELDDEKRKKLINNVFSYIGNDSNPPDAMIRYGDAIEVKKIESPKADIQLNSSYPKCQIESTSSMISRACKDAEEGKWTKDLLYVVGQVKNKQLKSIFMVYGEDYAASDETYLGVKKDIKKWIASMGELEFEETEELGRINMIDSLGITKLRVRGMWILQNPWKVFSYVTTLDTSKKFEFCAIINEMKYKSFPEHVELEHLVSSINTLEIQDIKIKNPNDSKLDIKAKMIRFYLVGKENESN